MNYLDTNVHYQLSCLNIDYDTNYSSKCTEQQLHYWAVDYYIDCNLFFQDDTAVPESFPL